MQVLFESEIHVHYSQFDIESRIDFWDGDAPRCFAQQANGICGAAVDGFLFLVTGLHTGNVGLLIELHQTPPSLEDEWEEAVEAAFSPRSHNVRLTQWASEAEWPLALDLVDYRVRYCAAGMDAARRTDTRLDTEPLLDRYRLQLWPARQEPDAVLRQTAEVASYWHTAWLSP